MQAVGKWLIIDEIKEQVKKTSGGLELASNHVDDIRYIKGKVLSPGLDVEGVEQGDTILYDMHAGHGIEIDGEFHKVIQERDIVMIL